jgi:hypothetical protein
MHRVERSLHFKQRCGFQLLLQSQAKQRWLVEVRPLTMQRKRHSNKAGVTYRCVHKIHRKFPRVDLLGHDVDQFLGQSVREEWRLFYRSC